jgi:hypothetical protein
MASIAGNVATGAMVVGDLLRAQPSLALSRSLVVRGRSLALPSSAMCIHAADS